MISVVIILGLGIVYFVAEIKRLKRYRQKLKAREEDYLAKYVKAKKNNDALAAELVALENKMGEFFFFYELTRKLAPILNKKELLDLVFVEMKSMAEFELLEPGQDHAGVAEMDLSLDQEQIEKIYISTESRKLVEYLPHFSGLVRLCLERAQLYEKLQQLSIYDSLTEVYNRRYFMLRYSEEFSRAQKYGFNLSFFMIDIDNFKRINDTYGHLVGDAVLRKVSQIIQENLREIDFVARFGGEEFSGVLLDTDKTTALMVAERILSRVSQKKISAFDELLSVTISIGVAVYPDNTRYPDTLLETADKALYKAKVSGKNRVCWF